MAESKPSQPYQTPLRPQASPRPTPPSSTSSFDFDPSTYEPGQGISIPSSEAQSPLRGRTLHRTTNDSHLVTRASTRRDTEQNPVDLEWRQRRTSREFTDKPPEYDHSLLEPLPSDRFRISLSEELHRAAILDRSIDIGAFGGHRDTFGILRLRRLRNRRVNLPPTFFAQVSRYLNIETCKAVRLTCHSWSVAFSDAHPLILPPVTMLPAEILERIFIELSPVDFNAARHTCRAWMLAGLEEGLLRLMLNRGGWSGAMTLDRPKTSEQEAERRASLISEDWFLSKRLATECSLGPKWSGHGMTNLRATTTGLQLTSKIDFSPLVTISSRVRNEENGEILHFAVSPCSRFLLASESRTIFIYALRRSLWDGDAQPYGGHLELLTRIVFPDQIIAVSMNTTSQHHAVAALQQGCVGTVCCVDLTGFFKSQKSKISTRSHNHACDGCQSSVSTSLLSNKRFGRKSKTYAFSTLSTTYNGSSDRASSRTFAEATLPEISSAFLKPETCPVRDTIEQLQPGKTASQSCPPFNAKANVSSYTIYPNLCSIDDPPRSVALCPQRRCVAFGCRRGIELHWVDALSGQALTRWFSLSTPSDFLYFMPLREGADNARKLRLVSSTKNHNAVRDDIQISRNQDHFACHEEAIHPQRQMHDRRSLSPNAYPEYYRAVPLSDGQHLLLTFRRSGELCLVRDDPRTQNSRKFTRRFVFVGPRNEYEMIIEPSIYAAANELRWGLRVAAAYRDQLWIFVVPPDLFTESEIAGKKSEASTAHESGDPSPIQIKGVEIASVANLAVLALDGSAGDLTLWAFTSSAIAFVFQLAGSGFKVVTQREAMSDGTIVLIQDADGDTVMTNGPSPPLDGSLQSDRTLSPNQGEPLPCEPYFPSSNDSYCNRLLDVVYSSLMTDADDTLMTQYPQIHAASVHSDSRSSLTPCFPTCNHRYCNLLLYPDISIFTTGSTNPPDNTSFNYSADTNISMSPPSPASPRKTSFLSSFSTSPEDEGYASADDEEFEQVDGRSAIYVPPLSSDWSQEDDMEWVPEYFRENGSGIKDERLGLDVLKSCRCECEIVDN